ncbi:cytochrome c [Candidatus Pelagibacter sp.]|jgi:cytochrome c6|nr:cytochrome c [Candidatus Pelagibacter sp.]|tara:strand:+ start:1421 stop:1744 length:324 start_codon:yes stop_codon:yes gene_type:complete
MKKLFINLSKMLLFSIFVSIIHVHADELFNKGKEVFLEAGNCVACHTLYDAGSNADIGPNLNEIRPNVAKILMAVKNGIGVMPAMEGILSNEEIEAVAHYVSISADQ